MVKTQIPVHIIVTGARSSSTQNGRFEIKGGTKYYNSIKEIKNRRFFYNPRV
jgi:hypothetical protein